ncbi:MAG: hypothetical protein J7M17_07605 [Anaerolineae bacterium]|nr:hypothetical protein [Anaerolineae bacterium]
MRSAVAWASVPLRADNPVPHVQAGLRGSNHRILEEISRVLDEINSAMPAYWVRQTQDALNDVEKSLKGSAILVLGVAYKKDTGDLRESPALDIIHLLQEKGARVSYHDP